MRLPVPCLAVLGLTLVAPGGFRANDPDAPRKAAPATVSAGLTDTLNVADAASEPAHGFLSGGNVTRGMAGDRVGGHDMRRFARTVRGAGSWVSYRLKVHPARETTLEFEEMNGRHTDVRGYLILVDGKKTYLRTWRGSGAGPVHFFVRVPPTRKGQVTVRLLNVGDAAFSVGRIWAFADFDRYFDAGRFAVPFYLAPTVHLSFSNQVADRAALSRIKTSLGDHPHARAAFTAFLPYAQLGAAETERRIDYALRLADETDMPVQLGFDTWWGSTPSGPDGAGGTWGDVQYQQVVYNATKRKYQLSIPNRWSSTPWLTVNHPRLNEFKARRLAETTGYLRRRHSQLLAAGKQSAILSINLDNEPVYWASGNAGLGSDLLYADFHPQAVAAAKRDGIMLDPADGLSPGERSWLSGNLLRYNERIGDAAVRGLGSNPAVVNGSSVTLPADHLAANIYTQAMVGDAAIQYPALDAAYPFWETAAPASVRVGGEWNADTVGEQQAVLHQIALGRNAAVNAETGNNAEKMRGVRVGFALAQRYYTPYNYPLDRMDQAASEIRDTTRAFPQFVFQPVLGESDFRGEDWRTSAAAHGGLTTGIIGNTAAVAAFPASSEKPGYLEYVVKPRSGGAFEGGPFLELTGRAFVFGRKDPNVHVRVLAGDGADAGPTREVARFFDTGHFGAAERIDLSDVARGKKAVRVRVELHAPGIAPDVLSWCSVRNVRFTAPWSDSVTRDLPPPGETLASSRQQNLVVSWRRDAELAIAVLAGRTGTGSPLPPGPGTPKARLASARSAYARGDYADAYQSASEGLGVTLPAAYVIKQSGPLAPYPIRVQSASPVEVTIREWSPARVRVTLQALSNTTQTNLRLSGLTPGARYAVRRAGAETTLSRVKARQRADLAADEKGEITLQARAAPYSPPAPPPVLRGAFRSPLPGDPPGSFFVVSEDGNGRTRISIDTRTIIQRGQTGQPTKNIGVAELIASDQIEARIGRNGIAISVTATPQKTVEGIVSGFGGLTPYEMPYVTLQGTDTRYTIDLSARLRLPSGDTNFRTSPLGLISLSPGDRVTLQTNPITGRVSELIKKPND